jgi:hypothetical protein
MCITVFLSWCHYMDVCLLCQPHYMIEVQAVGAIQISQKGAQWFGPVPRVPAQQHARKFPYRMQPQQLL